MPKEKPVQLSIDAESVAAARKELQAITRGNPLAEAAVAGFSDWEAVEALERMWAVALGADQEDEGPAPSTEEEPSERRPLPRE